MSYTSTAITRANLTTATLKGSPFNIIAPVIIGATTAYFDLYKCTLDFDNIAYIFTTASASSSDIVCKFSIGGVAQWETTGDGLLQILDCTGDTGNLVLLVEVKNDNALERNLTGLSMWIMEA